MVKHEFDKILLVFILLIIIYLLACMTLPSDITQWLREAGSGVLGGLLGLITSRRRPVPPTTTVTIKPDPDSKSE